MRLETLDVQSFGHFDRLSLDLRSECGLTILYGPNGAGKTTLLNAVRGLLFGVPQNSAYLFRSDGPPIEVRAQLRTAQQETIQVKRLRGRRGTLTGTRQGADDTPRPLSEESWSRYLGTMNASLYESFFGFTLADLRRGGEILKEATLAELLAGGALGGGSDQIRTLMKDLAEEADRRFKFRGHNQTILARCGDLERLKGERERHSVSQNQYRDLVRSRQACKSRREQLAEQVNSLRARHARLKRLVIAHPDFCQRREVLRQLSSSALDTSLSDTDASQVLALIRRAQEQNVEAYEAAQEVASIEERIAALPPVDEPLIRQGAAPLRRLVLQVGQVRALRRRVPALRERLTILQEKVALERGQLLPGTEADWIVLCASADGVHEQLKSFQRICTEINQQLDQQQDRKARAEAALEREQRILEGLRGTELPEEARPLASSLDALRQTYGDWQRDEAQWRARQGEVERRLARLSSPLPEDVPLVRVVLPDIATATALFNERQELQTEIQSVLRQQRQQADRIAETSARIASLREQAQIPTQADLAEARVHRDNLLERLSSQGPKLGDSWVEYRQTAKIADQMADTMIRESGRVAELVQLRNSMAQEEAALENTNRLLAERHTEREAFDGRWEALWQPVGVSLTEPAQRLAWLQEVRTLQQAADEADELRRRVDGLWKELSRVEDDLRRIFNAPTAQITHLLDLLTERRDAVLRDEGQRRGALERIEALQHETIDASEQLASLEQQLDIFEAGKREQLSYLGADPTMPLSEALHWIARVVALGRQEEELARTQQECEQCVSELESFDSAAVSLAHALESAIDGETPETFVERLYEQLNVSLQAEATRVEARESLATARRAFDYKQGRLEESRSKIAVWCEQTGVSNEDALLALAERAGKRASLQAALGDIGLRLARSLSEDLVQREDEERELSAADIDALVTERDQVWENLQAAQKELDACTEETGMLRACLDAWGGDTAARLQSEYEEVRAELNAEVEEFAVHHLAERILGAVVDRFARENQPALLRRSSDLLGRITNGGFPQVVLTLDQQALAVRLPDGSERAAERLSTGECEQLFLALRLAYILRYCELAEPLPVILDDVLVNFDEERQAATLRALLDVARHTQVLFFTCHQRLKQIASQAANGVSVIELPERS